MAPVFAHRLRQYVGRDERRGSQRDCLALTSCAAPDARHRFVERVEVATGRLQQVRAVAGQLNLSRGPFEGAS
jgi:hypothetical protein